MKLRKKKEFNETFYSGITGRPLDKSAQEIESQIRATMRVISGLTDEQIDALPDNQFDELYERAVESA